jgi:hypothetical protein
MQVTLERIKVEIEKLQVIESALAANSNGMTNMGSAALGSLNSMVSSTISA